MALYGSAPVMYAIHSNDKRQQVSGFVWLNPSDTFMKLERADAGESPSNLRTWWTSESGIIDVVCLVGPTPSDVSRQFHHLFGLAPLPPLWSLGKHQCRWNYWDEEDVTQISKQYDTHDIPLDVVWLDIEHTDGKKYFTWNPSSFPSPSKMMDVISKAKRKLVTIVDPHIKKDHSYSLYRELCNPNLSIQKVVWPRNKDIRDIGDVEESVTFEGWCWPGACIYPDFTNPQMRETWANQVRFENYNGCTPDVFTGNDMNEPSVFNGPEVTCPGDLIHPFQNIEHRNVHNLYGMYMQRGTYEGHLARDPSSRPFVLTRSFFIGSHRFGAIWTGDNDASWDHLRMSLPMLMALALSGNSFVGADVGGFFRHPERELIVRWYQLASLTYPFFRQHAHEHSPRREPWLWDEEALGLIRQAIQVRYKLLPYLYTIFADFHRGGSPVLRPLWWEFLQDQVCHHDAIPVEESVMVGDALLVRSVHKPLAQQRSVKVYLPTGAHSGWYEFTSGRFFAAGWHSVELNINSIPAFWRSGLIVPFKETLRRSSEWTFQDPFTLVVFVDPSKGMAKGDLYIDDYKTNQYKTGDFIDVQLEFSAGILSQARVLGSLRTNVSTRVESIKIVGLREQPSSAVLSEDDVDTAQLEVSSKRVPTETAQQVHAASVYEAVIHNPGIILGSHRGWKIRLGTYSKSPGRKRTRLATMCGATLSRHMLVGCPVWRANRQSFRNGMHVSTHTQDMWQSKAAPLVTSMLAAVAARLGQARPMLAWR
eukprot:TRINITY_DN24242_c0_g1_i1.p1 TRINITY_DN24242_c0_g1~~TRINITY_DN24242_c0_g1_i1.p1  ORF type:complete len:828 (+),score=99.50 TRINITY_DN24242_c0_g1_i1:199-2484(+)